VRILLAGDYPADPQLGSTKVLLKLQEEFRAQGHACDVLLADDLPLAPSNPYLRQAFGPIAALIAVTRMSSTRGTYDVIDVASAEGLWIALGRPVVLGDAVVISRSNGLEHLNYRRMLDDHAAGLLRKPWTRRLYHPLVRLTQVAGAARAADRLLLLNDVDRAFAVGRRWKGEDAIDVVPHGVSSRFLENPPSDAEPRGAGILFCGSWTGVKGVHDLVQAFTHLARTGPGARLTVLGGGTAEADIRAAFPSDVQRSLSVRPRVSEEAVMAAYREHDVLVWPSTYEGFGMVVIEAMSQRLPVVATPVGCASRLVVHEQTGLLVAPRAAPVLAAALRRMLDDRVLRSRCASAAFERVKDMSWAATASRTLEVYERARADRSRAH
jgi:glycosyltransferase involved in cell wall biosynthesis